MSVTVDTNILLYAANTDDDLHGSARKFLDGLARGPELLYLFWPTIMGFLRIATNPGIFPNPTPAKQAIAAITGLLERPNIRTPVEGANFWDLYLETAGEDTRGNHVPDAQLATLMREHGVTVIYTRDRDFRRYDGIEARDPFA